jgi:hypothetical protein
VWYIRKAPCRADYMSGPPNSPTKTPRKRKRHIGTSLTPEDRLRHIQRIPSQARPHIQQTFITNSLHSHSTLYVDDGVTHDTIGSTSKPLNGYEFCMAPAMDSDFPELVLGNSELIKVRPQNIYYRRVNTTLTGAGD